MKKTAYCFLALASGIALTCGCAKESLQNDAADEVILSANLPEESTKTAVSLDNQHFAMITWNAGDKLSVWGGENNEFTLVSEGGSISGNFSGSIKSGSALYAMYPYKADATCDRGIITTRVPNTQTAPEGSFDPEAAVMVGTISGSTITFKHAMAYLKITAPADVDGLLSITIESNDGTILTGDARFSASDRTYKATGLGCNFVTVKPAAGTFTAGAYYYAAVIPSRYGVISEGLTVRYLYKDDSKHKLMEKSKSNPELLDVPAGHVKTLGAADVSTIEATEKAVQLWADGPYWAKTNIGAKSASESGQYFAWGYEEGCVRNSDNTGWVLASDKTTVKNFNTDCFTDRKPSTFKDAAAANWGTDWSVPTYDEFSALNLNTDFRFQLNGGVNEYFAVFGRDAYVDNIIDLYRAGSGNGSALENPDYGYFLCSTESESDSSQAYSLCIRIDGTHVEACVMRNFTKSLGSNIRPVYRLK